MTTPSGRLVRRGTQEEVCIGDKLIQEGEEFEIMGWRRPHKPSSSGRVFVKTKNDTFERSLFPGVFDLEIIDFDKSWRDDAWEENDRQF